MEQLRKVTMSEKPSPDTRAPEKPGDSGSARVSVRPEPQMPAEANFLMGSSGCRLRACPIKGREGAKAALDALSVLGVQLGQVALSVPARTRPMQEPGQDAGPAEGPCVFEGDPLVLPNHLQLLESALSLSTPGLDFRLGGALGAPDHPKVFPGLCSRENMPVHEKDPLFGVNRQFNTFWVFKKRPAPAPK
eukprot:2430465-Alexandrium_andersonii.AAC.1